MDLQLHSLLAQLQNSHPVRIVATRLRSSLLCISKDGNDRPRSWKPVFFTLGDYKRRLFYQCIPRLDKKITSQCGLISVRNEHLPKLRKHIIRLQKAMKCSENLKNRLSFFFVRFVVGIFLVMAISVAVSRTPSYALTEENLLFLEAWRTIDRAYVDKTFNGQSWFRYRENALRNEPMNSRGETCMLSVLHSHVLQLDKAIRKMLATLDDPFTRFLEPEKFKSLRSGTQGSLTGVGLSIGYPLVGDRSPAGVVVISASPGGPANKAGILSGDVILKIDDTSTETMDIYDAAERLQ
ncbi:peptidase S41 family protein [Actinidia rufa]|uniref:Peptidase S41 family protein n=1 Tax=Actinidia rufa TaxID=165716 RepID=A0A7J0E678_9ERIC|nr:peptidase S41 family protein [Actinidia rufa]